MAKHVARSFPLESGDFKLNRRVRTVWAGSLRREDPRIVGAAIESVGLVGAHMHSKADDSLVRPRV